MYLHIDIKLALLSSENTDAKEIGIFCAIHLLCFVVMSLERERDYQRKLTAEFRMLSFLTIPLY